MTFKDDDTRQEFSREEMDEFRIAECESRYPTPLPQAGDKVFTQTGDLDAHFFETLDREDLYISGYQQAAVAVHELIKQNQKKEVAGVPVISDEPWLVQPLYFLHRQAIESTMKSLLRSLQKRDEVRGATVENDKWLSNGHGLSRLWYEMKDFVIRLVGRSYSSSVAAFEACLKEIDREDFGADAGRFAI